MPEATVRSLTVRPIQSVDLSFNVPGIIDFHDRDAATLGKFIDFPDRDDLDDEEQRIKLLYDSLDETYDSAEIDRFLANEQNDLTVLFSLRNQGLRTRLDEALVARQNAVLERHGHATKIAEAYGEVYLPLERSEPPPEPTTILERLRDQKKQSDERHKMIDEALGQEERDEVVKETINRTHSDSTNRNSQEVNGESSTVSGSNSTTSSTAESTVEHNVSTDIKPPDSTVKSHTRPLGSETLPVDYPGYDPPLDDAVESASHTTLVRVNVNSGDNGLPDPENATWAASQQHVSERSQNLPAKLVGGDGTHKDKWVRLNSSDIDADGFRLSTIGKTTTDANGVSTTTGTVTTTGSTNSDASQTTNSKSNSSSRSDGEQSGITDTTTRVEQIEFRYPLAENNLRHQRTQVELQRRILEETLTGFRAKSMKTIIENELRLINAKIRQLQLSLIHTHLLPPIKGWVSGIFKDVGERVEPGEPVMRIENDDAILLVGMIQYRGFLRVGDSVVLSIRNAFEGGGQPIVVSGEVVAVRGHEADNDEYDVILKCGNRPNNDLIDDKQRLLPLNYTLDRDGVTLTVN